MNNLIRSNSRDVDSLSMFKNDLWDVFDRFSRDFSDFDLPAFASQEQFTPRVELRDTGKMYQVCAEVPGMDEKDISVTLKNNSLIIEGEKRNETKSEDKKKGVYHSEFTYGSFYRAIPLSEDVDTEKINASYKNGLLNIEIEKRADVSSKTKKIQINAGKGESKRLDTKH